MKFWTAMVLILFILSAFLNYRSSQILKRADSLNKRSQILEQEIGKLDRRIKKQEGLPHGFGH